MRSNEGMRSYVALYKIIYCILEAVTANDPFVLLHVNLETVSLQVHQYLQHLPAFYRWFYRIVLWSLEYIIPICFGHFNTFSRLQLGFREELITSSAKSRVLKHAIWVPVK